jgi:hypothetical protein
MQQALKPATPTTTDQSDKLPTSSDPSFVSGRLGHQRRHWNRPRTSVYLAVKPTPGSLQINLLFTIFAEQAQTQMRRANFFSSEDNVEPKGALLDFRSVRPYRP